MKIERTHDKFYLDTERRNKEYFKELFKMIQSDFAARKDRYKLLDIGCATGDFLYFADEYLEADLYGIEYMKELIEGLNINAKVEWGDILDRESLPNMKFDCITMLGVMSIFDDFRIPLSNALSMLEEDGIMYLFGIFNPEDIDVLIKSKGSEVSFDDDTWESGWNLFSHSSVKKYLNELGYKCLFIPFNIGIEIPKNEKDPLRSWTEKMNDGYMIINGLQLRHTFYFCKIYK